MKQRACCLILLCLLVISARANDSISFTALVQQAQKHDARLSASLYTVKARKANVAISKSTFYPQLAFQSAYNTTKATSQDLSNASDRIEQSFSVNQRIFDERNRYEYLAVQEEVESATYNLQSTTQSVYQEVIQARLDLHLTQEQRELLEKRLYATQRQLKLVRRRESGGIGTHLDVALVEAEVATIEADLEAVIAEWESARQSLYKLTGIFVKELPKLKEGFQFPYLLSIDELLDFFRSTNPILLGGNHQIQALKLRERSAESESLPTISALGGYSFLNDGGSSSNASFQIRIPIYQGGGIKARQQLATSQRQSTEKSLLDSERQIEESIHQLHTSALSIIRREKSLRQAIASHQTLLVKTKKAWLEGVRLIQDVIDAEQNLFDAQRRQRNLYYQYLAVMTQLQQLIGRIDDDFLHQLDSYFIAQTNNN